MSVSTISISQPDTFFTFRTLSILHIRTNATNSCMMLIDLLPLKFLQAFNFLENLGPNFSRRHSSLASPHCGRTVTGSGVVDEPIKNKVMLPFNKKNVNHLATERHSTIFASDQWAVRALARKCAVRKVVRASLDDMKKSTP